MGKRFLSKINSKKQGVIWKVIHRLKALTCGYVDNFRKRN